MRFRTECDDLLSAWYVSHLTLLCRERRLVVWAGHGVDVPVVTPKVVKSGRFGNGSGRVLLGPSHRFRAEIKAVIGDELSALVPTEL